MCETIAELDAAVANCFACPRLVAWRESVATEKRAAFRDETYWGRPVPGFGPADARLLIVGLARTRARFAVRTHYPITRRSSIGNYLWGLPWR